MRLVFAVWALCHPLAPKSADALAIARAWAAAVEGDPLPPVFGSRRADLAVGAYWALRESWLRKRAVGDGGKSHGAWQQQGGAGLGELDVQAQGWLALLHEGARVCPASPAAPLSGGCAEARKLADRRVAKALELLARAELGI